MKIAKYQITYKNGVVQEKNLISHSDFENIIKPTNDRIYDLIRDKSNVEANSLEVKLLKAELKEKFGSEWFTDNSPLFEAITTGILELPESQGGPVPCIVKQI